MKKFIAYYRVSTKEQGNSGLGLSAQREAVSRFINNGNLLVSEFQEVESGRKSNRPQLIEAIKKCKETMTKLCACPAVLIYEEKTKGAACAGA